MAGLKVYVCDNYVDDEESDGTVVAVAVVAGRLDAADKLIREALYEEGLGQARGWAPDFWIIDPKKPGAYMLRNES